MPCFISSFITPLCNSPASFYASQPAFPSYPPSFPIQRRRTSLVFSHGEGGITTAEEKILCDRYGFDPNEIIYEPITPSPKKSGARRKDPSTTPNDANRTQVAETKPKPKRSTHKLLQVIGGTAKRKKLLSPKGMDVRPMMQVVKSSVFDILQAACGCPSQLRGGRWLDLYSGTGSVGIEALSRGCSEAHFVEMDPWVVSNVLKPNLECTGFLDDAVIHTITVDDFFQRQTIVDMVFDYISVTPPYTEVDYSSLMDQISKSRMIGEDTFIVVEYPLKTPILDSCGSLCMITERRFGRTNLAIYGPRWAQKRR